MAKIDYPILSDCFAYLDKCEEVRQYFYDNDVIGKIVKHIDLYLFMYYDFSFEKSCNALNIYRACLDLKTCYFGGYDTYFVCEFTDGTFLEIDYSVDQGVYIKYGNDLTLPEKNVKHIPPKYYNNLFDNLIGTKLSGVCMPTELYIQQDYLTPKKLYDFHPLGFLYLDFSNYEYNLKTKESKIITDDEKRHRDSIGFYCDIWHWPIIAYLSDRDIPCFESPEVDL